MVERLSGDQPIGGPYSAEYFGFGRRPGAQIIKDEQSLVATFDIYEDTFLNLVRPLVDARFRDKQSSTGSLETHKESDFHAAAGEFKGYEWHEGAASPGKDNPTSPNSKDSKELFSAEEKKKMVVNLMRQLVLMKDAALRSEETTAQGKSIGNLLEDEPGNQQTSLGKREAKVQGHGSHAAKFFMGADASNAAFSGENPSSPSAGAHMHLRYSELAALGHTGAGGVNPDSPEFEALRVKKRFHRLRLVQCNAFDVESEVPKDYVTGLHMLNMVRSKKARVQPIGGRGGVGGHGGGSPTGPTGNHGFAYLGKLQLFFVPKISSITPPLPSIKGVSALESVK